MFYSCVLHARTAVLCDDDKKKSWMKNNIYLPLYNPLPSLHPLTAAVLQEDNEYSTQR